MPRHELHSKPLCGKLQWAITAVFLNLSTNKINVWEGLKKRNACVGSSWCTSCETSITSSNHKIIVLFLLQSQKRKWNLEKMTVKRSSRTWHQSGFSVLRSEIFNNVEEILPFAFRELRLSWDIYWLWLGVYAMMKKLFRPIFLN